MTAARVDRADVSPRCRDGQHDRCSGHPCACPTCRPRPDGTGGHPSPINARAAKGIALQTERGMSMVEARLLLDMIGAVDIDSSTVTPDDRALIRIDTGAGSAAGKNADAPPCRRAPDQEPAAGVTTPPGLRILTPATAIPAVKPRPTKNPATTKARRPPAPPVPRQRTRASAAACGTTSGLSAHKRRGEPPCPACKDAGAAYQRDYYRRRHPDAGTRRPVAVCGTRAGYLRHLRAGETTCPACRASEAERYRARRRQQAAS